MSTDGPKTVAKSEDVLLWDGRQVNVRSLPIARLRKFMAAWSSAANKNEDEDGFDYFVDCCGIALYHNFENDFKSGPTKDLADKGEVLDPKYKEYLKENLDFPTIYLILDVAADLKLNIDDPKVLAAMMEQSKSQQ